MRTPMMARSDRSSVCRRFPRPAGQQKSFRVIKNRINRRRSRIMIPLCSGCPIPMSPRRKLRTKIPMAIVHAFRFLFHNCRDNTKRITEKARCTMRPISKDPCIACEILENGKKVKRNRKKEKTASRRIVIFSIRIRSCLARS